MSFVGVINLFRAPRATPGAEGGRMPLLDHLREFRARLLRSLLVFVLAVIVALIFYDPIFKIILGPYNDAREMLGHRAVTHVVITGVTGPLVVQLKICALAAAIVTCPYWLYQIWAFVLPGLYANERHWTRVFVSVAGPLFALGVACGYYILPKGIQVLISFTPSNLSNLVTFDEYLSFFTGMLLIFGVAFEIPLFVLLLNFAGIVSGRSLKRYRPWIIVGAFIFAAVATPSTDPFSMLMLALPMSVLFMISEVIARILDRRRARERALDTLSDDEASPL